MFSSLLAILIASVRIISRLPASLLQLNSRPPLLPRRPTRYYTLNPQYKSSLLNHIPTPGVGVGNPNASPTSALLLHILQDTSGRIATILFAHRVGTALEPECKTYRLAADVFNDIAMILDCLSPGVPAGAMRVSVLSTAGVLRALCGVAGGSSKASLSAHFAKWGNLAELNAKDSSQETVISLFGMLVGSVVVSQITGFATTWLVLLVLLGLHLSMNYAAVRAVQMTSLNRQRANIAFSTLLASDYEKPGQWTILTPAQVARQERIFHRDGALQWNSNSGSTSNSTSTVINLGSARVGVAMAEFLEDRPPLDRLMTIFEDEAYMLYISKKRHVSIVLRKGCSVPDQLKAWTHGLLAVRLWDGSSDSDSDVSGAIEESLAFLNTEDRFVRYLSELRGVGWNVEIAALETRGGRRFEI
ncbi:hypothetical protein N7541_001315 [Penicillium brevicompactum]|uniref:DUF647 domain-containing protein n=1 Tax=Penicillium brevicompactum TaxID=5074 RepID=A0A9W9V4I2_PENBR|nr:hypothetical protein N7541_001315 [Penicillium brevicompactum]